MISGDVMQIQYIGGIGDFGKLALLRHLRKDRRLAVCWYLTGENDETKDREKHFNYLKRPDEFRHLAPEVFDWLAEIVDGIDTVADPLTALQMNGIMNGIFNDSVFLRNEVPKRASLRRPWAEGLVRSVNGANLVFLDPDNGIQGKRLTNRHVALNEVAALRQPDRVIIICHHQSGRRGEARFLADRMRSLGCDPVEVIRLRLVTSRYYVILDHDQAMTELIAAFVRKWGNWVKSYRV
jgi:hypothetical protein